MADNTQLNQISTAGDIISTDDIGAGVKVQRVKVQYGDDGSATDVSDSYPLPTYFGDTAQLDANGRLRASNPTTIHQSKNIHSRNESQWEEFLSGQILEHGTVTGGPFQVGEEVTFSTSLFPGTVTDVNAGSIVIDIYDSDVAVGETITGGTSGATAVITSVDTGSCISHLSDEAAVQLQVGTASGDRALRQTHRYFPYIPQKSQQITITGVLGAQKDNVTRRYGYFDDDNGLFLEQTGNDVAFVVRPSTSGSAVDERIVQSTWSDDVFDGDGDSGETLDISKFQIFGVDFLWLGGGDVRFSFDIKKAIIAHTEHHANEDTKVYTASPSLPIRYEILNTGATGSVSTMKEVCSAISSEGGYLPPGLEYSTPISWSTGRGISTTREPILAIRLKNQFSASVTKNRRTVRFKDATFFAKGANVAFEVVHVHEPTGITAGWTDIGGGSGVEYSTDITAVTGRPSHTLDGDYVASGSAGKGTSGGIESDTLNEHAFLSQSINSDNSQMFVIYAEGDAAATAYAHISWAEFE